MNSYIDIVVLLQDSCVPGGVFIWSVENNSNQHYSVSLTFTFASGNGVPTYTTGKHKFMFLIISMKNLKLLYFELFCISKNQLNGLIFLKLTYLIIILFLNLIF